jgi:hypothetical protein
MSSVRNELALANAQELINVRGLFFLFPCIIARTNHITSHRKQMTNALQNV